MKDYRVLEAIEKDKWNKIREGKHVIMLFRCFLAKLKVIPFPESHFDSERFIAFYKKR